MTDPKPPAPLGVTTSRPPATSYRSLALPAQPWAPVVLVGAAVTVPALIWKDTA